MISKTFDNGMICASEQAVIVDKDIKDEFETFMKENNCYFLSPEETLKVSNLIFDPEKLTVNPDIVGHPAAEIAQKAGITVPAGTKILIAKLPEPSREYPLSLEKLSPVLAYFVCMTKTGLAVCEEKWNWAVLDFRPSATHVQSCVRYGQRGKSPVIGNHPL